MLTDLHVRRHSDLRSQAGSFWTDLLADREQARRLADLANQNRLAENFLKGLNQLAGCPGSQLVHNQWLAFDPETTISASSVDLDDPLLRLDDDQRSHTLSAKDIRYYGIPLAEILPLRIQSAWNELTLGADFFASTNRKWLLFRQPIQQLFPDARVMTTVGLQLRGGSWLNYLLRADVPEGKRDAVVRYVRTHQTPDQFERALAAVAGLAVLERGGELRHAVTSNGVTTYLFPLELVTVDYPHTALTVGATYLPGQIVGSGVRVYQAPADRKEISWWRAVSWGGGMILDPIMRRSHLKLEDRMVNAYVTHADDAGIRADRSHVRFQLADDFHTETAYWQDVARRETESGQFINTWLNLEPGTGLAYQTLITETARANEINLRTNRPLENPEVNSLPETKLVNPLDFFFQTVLGLKAYVVDIRAHECPRPAALYAFLKLHLPMTGTPIILDHCQDLPVETIGVTDTIRAYEQVSLPLTGPGEAILLSEPVDLSNVGEQIL